jgi:hypothetical protein
MVTQGVTKTQAVQFWYGIMDELKRRMRDAILLQPTQPTLASVFQLSERIEMNMVEEWAVTLAFDKENPIFSPMPLGQ